MKKLLYALLIALLSLFSCSTDNEELKALIPSKYYSFCHSTGIDELAEIDIMTGKLTLTGYKSPDFSSSNHCGCIFDENTDEFITFGYTYMSNDYRLFLTKGTIASKQATRIDIDVNKAGARDWSDIIFHKGKYYSFCRSTGIDELAEIDIMTGKLTWTGYKIPGAGTWSNYCGCIFDKNTDEFITLGYTNMSDGHKLFLTKGTIASKQATRIDIDVNKAGAHDWSNIIKY